MEPGEEARPTSVLLVRTAALYGAFALLPAGVLVATAGGWLWQRTSLGPTEHFTPVVDGLGTVALVGVSITALVAVLPALVFGVRPLRRDLRIGIGIALAVLHLLVVVGSVGSVASVGVAPVLFDSEKYVMRAKDPNRSRAALLYRDSDACTWTIYLSEPLDPVATQHIQVRCHCAHMEPAEVLWSGDKPMLVDLLHKPYSCPPPPSGTCSTAPGGTWLGVALALVGVRRLRGPCRAA